MEDDKVRETVIGCAQQVHNQLGAGFLEKVYETALRIELERSGLQVQQQVPIEVFYDGVVVGEFTADLLVQNSLLVELKAVQNLLVEHGVQLVNYLTATGVDNGLLINFGKSVEVRRKFRVYRKPRAQPCKATAGKNSAE